MESGSDSSDQGGSDAEHNEQDEIPDLDQGGAESGNESDGFIVDEHGQPLRGEKRKKKTHFFTDENLQMAEDIFGVDCDFGVFAEDDDEEDIEDYEDEDEEVHIFFREIKVILVSGFKLLLMNIQFNNICKICICRVVKRLVQNAGRNGGPKIFLNSLNLVNWKPDISQTRIMKSETKISLNGCNYATLQFVQSKMTLNMNKRPNGFLNESPSHLFLSKTGILPMMI